MITYNGNEMMLQNDMGNTLIQDSKTGHIMGLSEGFVPVGLKEHGGIMYVVSANREGVGEIGTIPSPILKLELRKEELSLSVADVTTSAGPSSTIIGITNFKVYPGEKFLPALNLELIVDLKVPQEFTILNIESPSTTVLLNDRLISPVKEGEGCLHTGLYELKLFSIYGSQVTELKHVYKKPMHPFLKDGTLDRLHDYWYYPDRVNTHVDIEKTWLNKGLHTYPGNLPPGKLAIKAELETIEYFDLPKISQSKQSKQLGTKAPYIYKKSENGVENYILAFPGFEYKTNSIRFIGKLDITLTNQTTGEPKCNETIEDFATVDISSAQLNLYQILQSGQSLYKKIEVEGPYKNALYFTPLFEVNIGQDLNAWYRLEVKYKDIYGGNIDTFVYSFNPYHILNYDESYYWVEWKANTLKLQKADIYSSESSYSESDTVSFDGDDYYNTQSLWSSNFIGSSGLNGDKYLIDEEGCVHIKLNDFVVSEATDSTKSKPMTAVYTKYLYGDIDLESGGDALQDYQYSMVTAMPIKRFKADNILSDNVPTGFHEIHGNAEYGSDFWNGGSDKAYLTFYFNIENPTIKYNLPILAPSLAHELTFLVDKQSSNDLEPFTGNIALDYKFGAPVMKNSNGYWVFDTSGHITYYTEVEHEQLAKKVIFQYQVPNQSIYSLIPSFSLVGDTDEELDIRLGLDRTGEAKKAWTFGNNLYKTSMPDKNTTDTKTSTFEKNACYYDETAVGKDLLLDAGVYLITVDAGMFNTWEKYYAKDGNLYKDEFGEDDVNQYGGNTDWENNNFSSQHPTNKDPRIAVIILNTYYQITRIDSKINGTHRRTFMPTLLYLPKLSIIRVEWKDVLKLQGIGIFRVTKPIVFNNGVGFDEGNDIKVMYYQHPDLREIILPIEATYLEHASCLDKEYDYYPGLLSLSYINRHVNMNADGVKFGAAPDRQGTWNYNNEDPTYIWDPNGIGLMEFIYQYEKDNHTQSTEIPSIAGNSSRLEYRKVNSTT